MPTTVWTAHGACLLLYGKVGFQVKIVAALLMLLVLLLPTAHTREYTQMNLPEGAVARLGKGWLDAVKYSPDGTQLAVMTTIGVWLYDTAAHREVALLTEHKDRALSMAFSPDGKLLASGNEDGTVLLWQVADLR